MRVEILSIDDPRWPEMLRRLRHDFYHEPAYVRLDAGRMGATPEAFLSQDGERVAFMPFLVRACNELFPDAGGPVFDAVSPYGYSGLLLGDVGRDAGFAADAFAALTRTLAERGVCSAFLRMHPILGNDFETLFPAGAFTDASETVAIDLGLDEVSLWKQVRQGHQETIKKCQKQGYTVRFVPLGEVLDEFVVIYEQTMDRVKAKESYYFGKDYFAELAGLPRVQCCVVESGSTIAAACLFLECDGIVQAHLGGTRSEFINKSPFHMTLYQATLWAKARGNRWLHLGGGVGGTNDKLLSFKGGFSPIRFHFLTARLITDAPKYRQLVDLKARALNTPAQTLLDSSFFPAYRSV